MNSTLSRVDRQVSILIALMLSISTLVIYGICTYGSLQMTLEDLQTRVSAVHTSVESRLSLDDYANIYTQDDMDSEAYLYAREELQEIRQTADLRYLYTAGRNSEGELVYMVDGLPLLESGEPEDPEDYRFPGDPIEEEIEQYVARALEGETVFPSAVLGTDWGDVFVAYFPIRNADGEVVAALGMEYSAASEMAAFSSVARISLAAGIVLIVVATLVSTRLFRRISNPLYQDLSTTDFLTQLKNRNTYEVDLANMIAEGKGPGMAVGVMDLNDLKHVNDTYGHETGDLYIENAGRALQGLVSRSVSIYRFGGDEFVLLLSDARAVEAVSSALEDRFAKAMEGMMAPASYAVGFAAFDPELDDTLAQTQARADALMYERKRQMKL